MSDAGALPMIDFLRAVRSHGVHAWEELLGRGYHPNVVYAKAEKASRKGYIDYGVSPRRGWLTDKGKEFIR